MLPVGPGIRLSSASGKVKGDRRGRNREVDEKLNINGKEKERILIPKEPQAAP